MSSVCVTLGSFCSWNSHGTWHFYWTQTLTFLLGYYKVNAGFPLPLDIPESSQYLSSKYSLIWIGDSFSARLHPPLPFWMVEQKSERSMAIQPDSYFRGDYNRCLKLESSCRGHSYKACKRWSSDFEYDTPIVCPSSIGTVTNLSPGTVHVVCVSALNASGESPKSPVLGITTSTSNLDVRFVDGNPTLLGTSYSKQPREEFFDWNIFPSIEGCRYKRTR